MTNRIALAACVLSLSWMAVVIGAGQDSTGQRSGNPVTFHKDVMPILQKNCESCHRPGQIGPFSMRSYQDVRPWARAIKTAVVSKKMPPS
jgi:hypothetical protein